MVDLELVSSLLESNAEDVLCLDRSGLIGRIDLDYVICALTLCLKDLKSLRRVIGSDDAVADFALEHVRGNSITCV